MNAKRRSLCIPAARRSSKRSAFPPASRAVYYILMHSHNDIGYTDIQPHIAAKQAHNVVHALELIEKTRDYPPGAQFKWNPEVFWQVEQFYKIATPEQKTEIRAGRARASHRRGRDVWQPADRPGARRRSCCGSSEFATALGRRCGVKVRFDDDQRRAGADLGHRARAGPGRREIYFRRPERRPAAWWATASAMSACSGRTIRSLALAVGPGARDLLGRAGRLFHRPSLRLDPRCHRRADATA